MKIRQRPRCRPGPSSAAPRGCPAGPAGRPRSAHTVIMRRARSVGIGMPSSPMEPGYRGRGEGRQRALRRQAQRRPGHDVRRLVLGGRDARRHAHQRRAEHHGAEPPGAAARGRAAMAAAAAAWRLGKPPSPARPRPAPPEAVAQHPRRDRRGDARGPRPRRPRRRVAGAAISAATSERGTPGSSPARRSGPRAGRPARPRPPATSGRAPRAAVESRRQPVIADRRYGGAAIVGGRCAAPLALLLAAVASSPSRAARGGLGEQSGTVALTPAADRKPAPAVSAPALDGGRPSRSRPTAAVRCHELLGLLVRAVPAARRPRSSPSPRSTPASTWSASRSTTAPRTAGASPAEGGRRYPLGVDRRRRRGRASSARPPGCPMTRDHRRRGPGRDDVLRPGARTASSRATRTSSASSARPLRRRAGGP